MPATTISRLAGGRTVESPGTSDEQLRATIAAYDAMAPDYALRFASTSLQQYMQPFYDLLPPAATVLDAGCGHGRDLSALSRMGVSVVGVDLSTELLRASQARTSAPLLRGDIRALPLRDRVVDGVWACASLVHLDRVGLDATLNEFRRVLRPGGAVFLSLRHGVGREAVKHGSAVRHFHFYEKTELENATKYAGLHILSSKVEPGVVAGDWINIFARRTTG